MGSSPGTLMFGRSYFFVANQISGQIISPQANKPVMGIVQDTLCGIRKFTLRDCFLDWHQVQNILLWVPDWDGNVPTPTIVKPKPMWTGKQILSMVIPKGVNIFRQADSKSPNGEILYGVVDKKTAGPSMGGLIHVVFREKGPEACRDIFTGLQQVVNYWLFHNSFSIGIGDTIADRQTMTRIQEMIQDRKTEVSMLVDCGSLSAPILMSIHRARAHGRAQAVPRHDDPRVIRVLRRAATQPGA
jgi:DNA-directed RNA polymerase II subunit RPB1